MRCCSKSRRCLWLGFFVLPQQRRSAALGRGELEAFFFRASCPCQLLSYQLLSLEHVHVHSLNGWCTRQRKPRRWSEKREVRYGPSLKDYNDSWSKAWRKLGSFLKKDTTGPHRVKAVRKEELSKYAIRTELLAMSHAKLSISSDFARNQVCCTPKSFLYNITCSWLYAICTYTHV